jgi:hypothetical protein
MPIFRTQNQYRGVNAHLHSLFQSRHGPQWMSFHRSLIISMTYYLNGILPRPYRARGEDSLQIQISGDEPADKTRRRVPDITIYQVSEREPDGRAALAEVDQPSWQADRSEVYPLLDDIAAIVIYRTDREPHIPVARLELLPPSNMAGGIDQEKYVFNRREALRSGLPLVEINYLHEYHPPVPGMPVYPADENAFPYQITVTDPRLDPPLNAVQAWGFGVDRPFPKLPIPLAGTDRVVVEFSAPYNQAFEGNRLGEDVDYEQEPPRLTTYRADDQSAIRARMAAVAAAQADEAAEE